MQFNIANRDQFDPAAEGHDIVLIELTKKSIHSDTLPGWVEFFKKFTASEEIASRWEGRLALAISGYDDDKREICEIDQVVTFMRLLTKAWPYWFHFCERQGSTLGVILSTHVDLEVVERRGSKVALAPVSADQMTTTMMMLFDGMNELYDEHGWPVEKNMKASDEINAAYARWLGVA